MVHSSDSPSFFNASPRLLVGVGLVVFGALLLLGRLDIVDTEAVVRLWPLILIAIGVQQFFNARVGPTGERVTPVNAIIWMAIGGILLLNTMGLARVGIWELFWPAILIAIGVRLMTRPPRVRMHVRHDPTGTAGIPGAAAPTGSGFADAPAAGQPSGTGAHSSAAESADAAPIFAVLSGVRRVAAATPFYGTEITSFMGGAHLDLRRAIVPPGGEAVIDLFTVMGSCEIVIPSNWVVSAPLVALMGGVDDKRLVAAPSVIEDRTASAAAPPRLVIRGFVMMGGVILRS
jgi:predicted membrane protein